MRDPSPRPPLDEATLEPRDEMPAGSSRRGRRGTAAAVALIVLAFAASALPGMPGQALSKASQARAWLVAKTMAETGDFAIPRYHGETRLKKPPLQSWVQASTMDALSSADLWVAGLGTWIVGLLFAMGPWLLGRAIGRPEAGLVGSLLLCASRATITWGASPEHDVPFAGWIALSWAFLARALSERGRLRDAAAAGLAAGAALLTKDPFVLAFVPGTALVLRWRPTARGPLRGLPFWSVLLGATLVPAVLWLTVVAVRLGSVGAVFDEMWRQASGSEGAHTKPFPTGLVYYVGVVTKTLLPWSPIALGAMAVLLVRRRREGAGISSPWLRLPGVAFLVGLVTLTAVPAKQEHYVLPILVPAALLAGHALVAASRSHAVVRRALPWAIVAAAVAYAVTRWTAARSHFAWEDLGPKTWIEVGALLALALLVAGRRATIVACTLAAAAMGAAGVFDAIHDRATDDYRDSVTDARAQIPEGVPVVGFALGSGEAFDAAVAWMDRPYERVRSVDELRARLDRGDRVVVLVRKSEKPGLGDVASRLTARGELSPASASSDRDRILLFEPSGG